MQQDSQSQRQQISTRGIVIFSILIFIGFLFSVPICKSIYIILEWYGNMSIVEELLYAIYVIGSILIIASIFIGIKAVVERYKHFKAREQHSFQEHNIPPV